MQVWDFAGPGFIRFNASDSRLPHLGYIVENKLIVSSLLRRIQAHPSVSLIAPAKLQTIKWPKPYDSFPTVTHNSVKSESGPLGPLGSSGDGDGDGDGLAEIHFESRPPIQARLVIGADGSRSRVRSLAGLRTVGWPYHQRGVISTVDLASPSITAWQRFLPSGPLALLPLGDNFSNVVWSTTEEHALKLQSMSPGEFAGAVNEAFRKDFASPGLSQGTLKLPFVPSSAAAGAAGAAAATSGAAAAVAAAASAVSAAAAAAGNLAAASLSSALASATPLQSLFAQAPPIPYTVQVLLISSRSLQKFYLPGARFFLSHCRCRMQALMLHQDAFLWGMQRTRCTRWQVKELTWALGMLRRL
ncbi:hypothetical protein CLOP_g1116 [Closterium sp. NIES-67]|nr:hypothetical protein CLOP_g1116 [Closterium sp. NIES-67]